MDTKQKTWVNRMARAGLSAKGFVYVLLGVLAFMAAFDLRQASGQADHKGVLDSVQQLPGGMVLLLLLAAGLVCYSTWRLVQTAATGGKNKTKKWGKRIRYLFSALTYLALAFTALQMALQNERSGGDKNQYLAARIISQPSGNWLLLLLAALLAGVGVYQLWYALSEQYKKHMQQQSLRSKQGAVLLLAGKTGYVSRGIVWLLLSFLFFRAAIHANPKEAGDTATAFQFLENWSAGAYLPGLLGLGLVTYGIFNFVRARFEKL